MASIVEEHDLQSVSAVAWLLEALRQLEEHQNTVLAGGVGITFAEQVADFVKDHAKEIRTAMLRVESMRDDYFNAEHGMKTAAKQVYIEAHRELKHKFAHFLKDFHSKPSGMRLLEFVNNRDKFLTRLKMGVPNSSVMDTNGFRLVTKMARGARMVGKGCIV